MSQIPENLGKREPSLKDVYFIEGIGLRSNIFAFTEDGDISLVDTGSGIAPNEVAPQLEQLGLRIEKISKVVITHGHIDHIGGLTEIAEHCSPRVFVHQNDSEVLGSLGIKSVGYLTDGDTIRLGQRELEVLHTPGHTEGSICCITRNSYSQGTPPSQGDTSEERTFRPETGENSSIHLTSYLVWTSESCCRDMANRSSQTHLRI